MSCTNEDLFPPQELEVVARFVPGSALTDLQTENTRLQELVADTQAQNAKLKAAFHLVAHEVVFLSESDAGCFIRPLEWTMGEDKILDFFANVNDTFGYACADAERMTLDEVLEVHKDAVTRFPKAPWVAVALWAQKKRNNCPFIPPVQKMIDAELAKVAIQEQPTADIMEGKSDGE